MTYRVDLHTHSTASKDGGIQPEQYRWLLQANHLNCVAITDHNRIDMALSLHDELGDAVIVGEEISTQDGDIIGLFLTRAIQPNRPLKEVVQAIRSQGGLVYIPHPFETVRHGIKAAALESIAEQIDIVEVYNGRAVFQNRGPSAVAWARLHGNLIAASSDAHGIKGIGTAYTLLDAVPTRETLQDLLGRGRIITSRPPLITLLSPKYNRLLNKIKAKE